MRHSAAPDDSGSYKMNKKGTGCPGIHADNNITGTESQS
jgi:hypothetical protein